MIFGNSLYNTLITKVIFDFSISYSCTSILGLLTALRSGSSVVVPYKLFGLFRSYKYTVPLGVSSSISTILDLIV